VTLATGFKKNPYWEEKPVFMGKSALVGTSAGTAGKLPKESGEPDCR
jgi:hypothetical protein